jgi:tryptophanyl-tRNA synthetase
MGWPGGAIETETGMKRVFSGIQPTGNLHLGNYLGAIRNWVRMQDEAECIFCVVDLHAITVAQDPATLRRGIREMTAALIAAGLDPERCILFPQSQVRVHAELAWVLMCTARVGWLNRMTQFKEKSGKDREGASVGLYTYPVLQAADILAYRATHVPVGEDQKQHLELARDIAAKFNTDMGIDLFPLPEPVIEGPATRVMSLRDGSAKMSKSDPSDQSRINLTDDADTIAAKVKRAKTDPDALPSEAAGLAGRAEAANLVGLMAALTDSSVAAVLADWGGKGFGAFKPALADVMVARLAPITARFNALRDDQVMLDAVLATGAARARAIAEPVLADVHRAVGFR